MVRQSTAKTKNRPKRVKRPSEVSDAPVCELNQPIWAVTGGLKYYGLNLTYAEAVELLDRHPDGIIVTMEAAARLPN